MSVDGHDEPVHHGAPCANLVRQQMLDMPHIHRIRAHLGCYTASCSHGGPSGGSFGVVVFDISTPTVKLKQRLQTRAGVFLRMLSGGIAVQALTSGSNFLVGLLLIRCTTS